MKIKEISLQENVTNKNAHQVNYREEGAYIHSPGEMPVNEYELPSKDIHGTKLSQCASEGVISLADALEAEQPCGTTTAGSSKVSAIYPNCEAVKASHVNLSFSYPEYSRKSFPLECYSAKADSCLLSSSRKCSKDKDAVISDKSEEEANKKEVYKRSIQFSRFDNNNEMGVKEHLQVKERLSGDNYKHSGLLPGNSDRELSPWTKEKSLISHSAFGTGSVKHLDVSYLVKDRRTNKIRYKVEHESLDWEPCKRKKRYSNSNRGNYDVKLEKFNNRVDGRTLGGHQYNDSSRSYQYGVNENKNLRMNNTSWRNRKFPAEKNSLKHHQRRSSHWFPRNEVHRMEADTRRGNTKYQLQYRNYQDVSQSLRPFLPEDSESSPRLINISDTHFSRKSLRAKVNVSWTRPSQASYRNSWHNLQRHNDIKVRSPTFCYEANNAFEEAEDLKHSANSLKASGLRLESTELFFQAALKYLSGASLLEPRSSGSGKYVEMTSVKIYDTTAKLLEYCAQEYESCKDMACAALAYKCMEVSNMRKIYSNDFIASKDCHELQVAFQSVPSAESSSTFSANDNNFNNQLGGDYVFNSRSQSKFSQLINFAQYANSAMEASTKSQICFASASRILEDKGSSEVGACIKRVLNCSFHNMNGLLHLVQEAMEALST